MPTGTLSPDETHIIVQILLEVAQHFVNLFCIVLLFVSF